MRIALGTFERGGTNEFEYPKIPLNMNKFPAIPVSARHIAAVHRTATTTTTTTAHRHHMITVTIRQQPARRAQIPIITVHRHPHRAWAERRHHRDDTNMRASDNANNGTQLETWTNCGRRWQMTVRRRLCDRWALAMVNWTEACISICSDVMLC